MGGTNTGGTSAGTEAGGTDTGGTSAGAGGSAGSSTGHGTGYDVSNPGAVKDNQTGLVFQQLADGNYASLNWGDAVTYCSDLQHAGFDDWRLPSGYELFKLVRLDYTGDNHHDLAVFPNSPGEYFWTTGEPWEYGGDEAWRLTLSFGSYVDFLNTPLVADLTEFEHRVRCVRGGQVAPPRFTEYGDGRVLDGLTGLVWEQFLTFDLTLAQAHERCATLPLAGGGWRMPTVVELMSVVLTDALETAWWDYVPLWTASPYVDAPPNQPGGWVLFEADGTTAGFYGLQFDILAKSRCVR